MTHNPIIIPLDVPTLDEARRQLDRLHSVVEIFKIGKQLFTAEGPETVRLVHSYGKRVFLDLKYHDIPNTVAEACLSAARLGVWMLNLHISGGRVMVTAAREAVQAQDSDSTPLLIGVTVLTSLDAPLWEEVFGQKGRGLSEQVVHMAELAKRWGLNGVVASPQEITGIREGCGSEFLIVTPGVRPRWAAGNDQRRAMTPGEALRAGADYLVIGRPITAASNPLEATHAILDELARV